SQTYPGAHRNPRSARSVENGSGPSRGGADTEVSASSLVGIPSSSSRYAARSSNRSSGNPGERYVINRSGRPSRPSRRAPSGRAEERRSPAPPMPRASVADRADQAPAATRSLPGPARAPSSATRLPASSSEPPTHSHASNLSSPQYIANSAAQIGSNAYRIAARTGSS